MKRPPTQPPRKPRADWLAWSLQLAFGMLIGGVVGLQLAFKMFGLHFIGEGQLGIVSLAAAFFFGGILSHRGDRAWFRPSVFDPEPPPQSPASRRWSWAIGCAGSAIFLGAVLWHWSGRDWPEHHSFAAVDLFFLALAAILGAVVIHALRTGTALGNAAGVLDRYESPFQFWFYVSSVILTVIFLVVVVLFG